MTPQPEWINKADAAARLKVSERHVLFLASRQKIESRKVQNGARGQAVIQLLAADVERYAYERDHPEDKPAETAIARLPKPETARAELSPELVRMLELGFLPMKSDASHIVPWVTVDEAAEFSGLPASAIRTLIQCGELPAIDCGPRKGGKWRIKRVDLEKLEGHR